LPSKRRREATVLNEYNKAWATIDYAAYSMKAPQSGHTLWDWRGARMLASDVGATASGSCC
jgi:hypothetical protein